MVSNSFFTQSFSRAQEWIDRLEPRERSNIARVGVLLGMATAAGALLLALPDSDDDVAAEAFALSASVEDGGGGAGAESGALGRGEAAVSDTDDMAAQSTADYSDLNASAIAGDVVEDARFAELAVSKLDLSRFTRKSTTTQPPTTKAPTTAAPTTAAPTTTTEAPTTAAESTEATADETTSTAAETTAVDGTDTSDGTGSTDTSDGADTTEPTETTDTTVEQTTTTAAPPTTADNGFVDAGHGVAVPAVLLEIRYCESRDNYTAANPSSSARGAYQFLTGSWAAYGHADRYGVSQAHLATPAQQDEAALITWQRDGTRPWNASSHCWG